jgi:adenylate cyclase
MDNILKNDKDKFTVMEREVTVIFTNINNFINISETMENPSQLVEFLNGYMEPMTEIIMNEKGTIDKFIGDTIMAYWNAPSDIENHPDIALITSLKQLYKVDDLNRNLIKLNRFKELINMCEDNQIKPIQISIGLNTGDVIAGEMGSKIRSDYTIIGNSVNLGAKLESLCIFYGSKCNITNFTKWKLKDNYIFRYLDLVIIKGHNKAIQIWEVIDFEDGYNNDTLYDTTRDRLDEELFIYHRGLDIYQSGNFQEALEIFEELEAREDKSNQKIYKIYIDRCKFYIDKPPKDFNGVFQQNFKD